MQIFFNIDHDLLAIVSDLGKLWSQAQEVVESLAQEGEATSPVTSEESTRPWPMLPRTAARSAEPMQSTAALAGPQKPAWQTQGI